MSQVPVALYPDPHAAPFTPIDAASSSVAVSSSVAQRVVERRCLRHELLQPSAVRLLQCTFISLRAVLRRWWSRDLFGCHDLRRSGDSLDFRMLLRSHSLHSIHSRLLQILSPQERVRVPAFCKHRYIRVRNAVLLKCTLMPVLSVVHRWWDHHLLPHPADRPHLFGDKLVYERVLAERPSGF
jgi:hypothetical protein